MCLNLRTERDHLGGGIWKLVECFHQMTITSLDLLPLFPGLGIHNVYKTVMSSGHKMKFAFKNVYFFRERRRIVKMVKFENPNILTRLFSVSQRVACLGRKKTSLSAIDWRLRCQKYSSRIRDFIILWMLWVNDASVMSPGNNTGLKSNHTNWRHLIWLKSSGTRGNPTVHSYYSNVIQVAAIAIWTIYSKKWIN